MVLTEGECRVFLGVQYTTLYKSSPSSAIDTCPKLMRKQIQSIGMHTCVPCQLWSDYNSVENVATLLLHLWSKLSFLTQGGSHCMELFYVRFEALCNRSRRYLHKRSIYYIVLSVCPSFLQWPFHGKRK